LSREIEAKLRVSSHEPVRARLRALGAAPVGGGLETNWIYDHPDGSLRAGGMGLRIRAVKADAGGDAPATMTVKGPVADGPLKSREELEIRVDSADTARALLEMLGFAVILHYQKRRESWALGVCRVELDEPPHIGRFVEIEGPDVETIRRVQDDLGLADSAHVAPSYVHLLLRWCRERNVDPRRLLLP
jgi:adenylate cyclase class 2